MSDPRVSLGTREVIVGIYTADDCASINDLVAAVADRLDQIFPGEVATAIQIGPTRSDEDGMLSGTFSLKGSGIMQADVDRDNERLRGELGSRIGNLEAHELLNILWDLTSRDPKFIDLINEIADAHGL